MESLQSPATKSNNGTGSANGTGNTGNNNGAGNGVGIAAPRRFAPLPPRPARGKRSGTARPRIELPSRRSTWGLAWKFGLAVGLGLGVLLAFSQPPASPRAAVAATSPYGLSFGSGDPAAVPLWDLPAEASSSDASSDSAGGGRSQSARGAAEDPRAPAPDLARQAGEEGHAAARTRAELRQSTSQGRSRGFASSTGLAAFASESPGLQKPRASGQKRRTSVAISMEEEKAEKATAPKPRIKTKSAEPTFQPKPAYPAGALKEQKSGLVRVRLRITTLGTVAESKLVQGEPSGVFEQAVLETVQQWRFTPARDQDGKPMESWVPFEFSFELQAAR